jgi:hypothetical protein
VLVLVCMRECGDVNMYNRVCWCQLVTECGGSMWESVLVLVCMCQLVRECGGVSV